MVLENSGDSELPDMSKKTNYLKNILEKIKYSDVFIFSTGMTNSFIFKFWEIYDYDRLSYNTIRHGYK